jgi:hypothetical protein
MKSDCCYQLGKWALERKLRRLFTRYRDVQADIAAIKRRLRQPADSARARYEPGQQCPWKRRVRS